jgi:crossover junction endodeoxyribonuclease RuvC
MPSARARPRVIGIDPGTRLAGYAIVDVVAPGRFAYVECGVLDLRKDGDLGERLVELAAAFDELLAEFAPHELAIERAFHGLNAQSVLKLSEARGVLKLLALQAELGVHEYAPALVKRAVVGKGRATKAEVQQRVRMLCQLAKAPQADAADALAIAICHVQSRVMKAHRAAAAAKRKSAK